jgi:hypothetical protein
MSKQTVIRCPNCAFQFPVNVETLIDAGQNPQAKVQFLSGNTNTFACPNCGAATHVAAPILYHDLAKELLIAFVPPELNLPKAEREKAIGELMRELTASLPQGAFKSYMFQPREALTMQGMMDQILEADGVTPEMMAAQRERLRLLETLLGAPEETRQSIIEQNDAKIDTQFMQTMTLLAQRMAAEGRGDIAQQLVILQEDLLEFSSFGRVVLEQAQEQEIIVQEVAAAVGAMGDSANRQSFLELAKQYADDDQRLQALVGLARPAFDYVFFQDLTTAIGQSPADERDALELLRDKLLELTQAIDQQTQAVVQDATRLLQALVNASDEDADALILENLPMIDDAFLSVLMANLQEAEKRGDQAMLMRLENIYARVMGALRETMPPELQFVNELLSAPSEEEAKALIADNAAIYGEGLLATLDAVSDAMTARGESAVVQRIHILREAAEAALGA